MLQRRSDKGGLALPNLQLYFWACQMRSHKIWLETDTKIAWCDMEALAVFPHPQDVLYTGLPEKGQKFGYTIVGKSLKICLYV